MSNVFEKIKSFFSEEEKDDLQKAYDIIKELFKVLNINEKDAKLDIEDNKTLGWGLQVNSINIYIYIYKTSDEDSLFLKIVSPILFLPNNNILPFYRRLLEANVFLHDIGFCIENNVVLLMAQRRIDLTSIEECKYILMYLAEIAEQYIDELKKEFKAKPYYVEE